MGKRIAITGANGQLGQTLMRSELFEEHILLPLGRDDMDITDQAKVSATLDSLKPPSTQRKASLSKPIVLMSRV